ncbi:replication-associated recombination protein A [Bacteroidia bacterium]|nr:replication-associated recombination protein A [Bacteroidia bacterium]
MNSSSPLAERMRPTTLEEYVGQKHIIGEKTFLFSSLKEGRIPSMILWGPPGVGKTSLAELISKECKRPFYALSAINSGVKDIRNIIEKAKNPNLFKNGSAILFIDEIHRFSKSQQDSLLAAVEKGWVTLIGATTENPSFEVIPALRSRCQTFVLEPLAMEDMKSLVNHAVEKDSLLSTKSIDIIELEALIKISGGDARKLLNALEIVVLNQTSPIKITNALVKEIIQNNLATYDKGGEHHYNVISAFIKSVRGSDPNAAVYWLARMLLGGEEPRFIARRLVILASEDIGLANSNALLLASQTMEAVHQIGMPESRILLSQCTIYLATSPKSNSAYEAINKAMRLAEETHHLPVPLALRNAPTAFMKDLDYGTDYEYSHSGKGNFIAQNFMPEELKGKKLFEPGHNKKEKELKELLKLMWANYYEY